MSIGLRALAKKIVQFINESRNKQLGFCKLDQQVRIANKANFKAGKKTVLYHGTYIQNNSGTFVLGTNSHLGAFCYVNVTKGTCTIGDNTSIGPGVKIIVYSNHFAKGQLNTDLRICENVNIGNNVFIGANVTILPGTTIKDNVVVGAGAVVKGTLSENCIYAGVPAKILKKL